MTQQRLSSKQGFLLAAGLRQALELGSFIIIALCSPLPFLPNPSFSPFLLFFLLFFSQEAILFMLPRLASISFPILPNAGTADMDPAHHCLCNWNRSPSQGFCGSDLTEFWCMGNAQKMSPLVKGPLQQLRGTSVYTESVSFELSQILSKGNPA